ncbi:MAG: polymer-forming cytoskeletal protein [Chitinophagaceae bacterium]
MSIFSSNKDTKDTTPSYTPQSNPMPSPASTPSHSASNHSSSSYSSSASYTSISEGTNLEGQIKIEGDIKVEGVIKGTVTSKGKVMVSSTGKIDGDVICQNAEIAGHVTGKIKIADILILKGNAVVDGDINTGKLVIESGVKFNGNCTMGVAAVSSAPSLPKADPIQKPTTVELNVS